MHAFVFIVKLTSLGALCAIPGVIVGRLMARKGIVRDQTIWVIITGIIALLFAGIASPDVPLVYFVILDMFFAPLALYRADLWTTYRKGRWWWLNKT